jgi:hypothetical protein
MTKLEQVARGMWAARQAYGRKHWPNLPQLEAWDDAWPHAREAIMEEARAAIEAMRKPTEAMSQAGGDITIPAGDYNYPIYGAADEVWNAMIDAALKEGT